MIKSCDYLSDSTFLYDVNDVHFREGSYLVADRSRGQILRLSADLEVTFTYGTPGEGPGEFEQVPRIWPTGDSIFAVNAGKKKIEVFHANEKMPLRSIDIDPAIVSGEFDLRFFGQADQIYITAPEGGFPVVRLSSGNGLAQDTLEKVLTLGTGSRTRSAMAGFYFQQMNWWLLFQVMCHW